MWGIIATWCMAYDGINKASEMLKMTMMLEMR